MLLRVSLQRMVHCWNDETDRWMTISFRKMWRVGSLGHPFCCEKQTVAESEERDSYVAISSYLATGYQSLPAEQLGNSGRWGKAAPPSVWHQVCHETCRMFSVKHNVSCLACPPGLTVLLLALILWHNVSDKGSLKSTFPCQMPGKLESELVYQWKVHTIMLY